MPGNPRYDILFEPIKIGPVTAPNRFYQTPHATGMGKMAPNSSIALRALKAEGGWGVVCTEYCSIHPSADEAPYAYLSLWDDQDEEQCKAISDAIHAHGSLSAIELWHGGFHCLNRATREAPLAPSACSAEFMGPTQVREMAITEIRQFRKWHRDAALRAKNAGYDIIYVYAGHEYLPFQFLSPRFNQRHDEYGGNFENRCRLLRELIEDTREAVGDSCAVAVRFAIDELHGSHGISHDMEGKRVIEMLGELPDLWDIALGGSLGNDSCSSRFSAEGYQEEYVSSVKSLTSKPVVSVGRFTSPDTMVGQIKRGVQDFIGAARPSIADPFLPYKLKNGLEDQIRECIGCNICRSANNEGIPLRCTQNPTMGEEWRRGWHPEIIPAISSPVSALVVGGGPAGLEATLALAKRGVQVTLADANEELGGRLLNESRLPGLSNWIRVRDYRAYLISQLENVDVYLNNPLTAEDINDFETDACVIATGARWRRNGLGLTVRSPIPVNEGESVLTPDDLFAGVIPGKNVTIYDDEHYFMAGALAELLILKGHQVTYITPAMTISSWTEMTNEQAFIQSKLTRLGIKTCFGQMAIAINANCLTTQAIYSEQKTRHDCDSLLLVTGREK
ncbi:MAG: FAD-dependent oxidoreductase [Pseudomonadota bacterium]